MFFGKGAGFVDGGGVSFGGDGRGGGAGGGADGTSGAGLEVLRCGGWELGVGWSGCFGGVGEDGSVALADGVGGGGGVADAIVGSRL